MGPVREIPPERLRTLPANRVPPIRLEHFMKAIKNVEKSVSKESLQRFKKWADKNDAVGQEEAKTQQQGVRSSLGLWSSSSKKRNSKQAVVQR